MLPPHTARPPQTEPTLDTNYFATVALTDALLTLVRDDGERTGGGGNGDGGGELNELARLLSTFTHTHIGFVVNVASLSGVGALKKLSAPLRVSVSHDITPRYHTDSLFHSLFAHCSLAITQPHTGPIRGPFVDA